LHVLHELTDYEVSEKITAVKGLGRWSADMFKSITAAYAG
jgi:3-methyladenine DNA glycosylase/8-oxoguanine DNA glycosylase